MERLDRVTRDPRAAGGRARIRGMRVTAGLVVGQAGARRGIGDLLAGCPWLGGEDILQALRHAAWLGSCPARDMRILAGMNLAPRWELHEQETTV